MMDNPGKKKKRQQRNVKQQCWKHLDLVHVGPLFFLEWFLPSCFFIALMQSWQMRIKESRDIRGWLETLAAVAFPQHLLTDRLRSIFSAGKTDDFPNSMVQKVKKECLSLNSYLARNTMLLLLFLPCLFFRIQCYLSPMLTVEYADILLDFT